MECGFCMVYIEMMLWTELYQSSWTGTLIVSQPLIMNHFICLIQRYDITIIHVIYNVTYGMAFLISHERHKNPATRWKIDNISQYHVYTDEFVYSIISLQTHQSRMHTVILHAAW